MELTKEYMNTAVCFSFDHPQVRDLIQKDEVYFNVHIYIDMKKIETLFLCDLIKLREKMNKNEIIKTKCLLVFLIDEKKYMW